MEKKLEFIETLRVINYTPSNERGSLMGVGLTFVLMTISLLIVLSHQASLIASENKIRRQTYKCQRSIERMYQKYINDIKEQNKVILMGKGLLLTPFVKAGRLLIAGAKLYQEFLVKAFFFHNKSLKGCSRSYTYYLLTTFPFKTMGPLKRLFRVNDLAITRKKEWKVRIASKSIIKERTFALSSKVKIQKSKAFFETKELNLASSWLSGLVY